MCTPDLLIFIQFIGKYFVLQTFDNILYYTYIPNESLFKTTKVYNSTVHIKIFFLLSQSGKTFQCSITLAEQHYNWGTQLEWGVFSFCWSYGKTSEINCYLFIFSTHDFSLVLQPLASPSKISFRHSSEKRGLHSIFCPREKL